MQAGESYLGCHIHVDTLVSRASQTEAGDLDSGMSLSITIDKLRVFINKTLSTQSLINQLSIKRVDLSISIDSREAWSRYEVM